MIISGKNQTNKDNKDAAVKPYRNTLHRLDAEEHLEGAISSIM
ncbi:hypothetical protein BH11BAC4_BH11BAC4_08910 [soil metagenome]